MPKAFSFAWGGGRAGKVQIVLEGYIMLHLGCVSKLVSQSIPSLTTYSPLPQQSHAWGPGFAHTHCPGRAGFDGSGEVGKFYIQG